jgi:ribosomal subunit interface protein
MQTPLQITFRHMDPSPAVEARIREHVDKLEKLFDRITACHVMIETPPAHKNKGAPFDVRIDLRVPGKEIYVHNQRNDHDEHADFYTALNHAFDCAKRKLHDYAHELRGDVKRHSVST